MSILNMNLYQSNRYGITEKKKAELDEAANMVLDAQYDVEQLQAIVNSLTEKSQKFQIALATAEANKTHCFNNRTLLDQVVQQSLSVMNNSNVSFNDVMLAGSKTKEVATGVKKLIDKLIYSAEVVNELSAMIVRRKALNPLISDELGTRVATAGADANNAVALTLVALQSSFTTQATGLESEAAATLEYQQAILFYTTLTGTDYDGEPTDSLKTCLQTLIEGAYTQAEDDYKQAHRANHATTKELNDVTAKLNTAQIKLKSLQSGYAAANAAALAS
jgi:hypothetical protein